MSDTTPRAALPELAAAQAQKHVTHNEALLQMDALLCARILDRDLTAPPGSPSDGDAYIVKATGTGAWVGQDGKIAFALDGAWRFYAPFAGLTAYIADDAEFLIYNGTSWVDLSSVLSLENLPMLGVNTTADSTNKLAVASSAVLLTNIGGSIKTYLNKHASGDTASFLFETNFSGRAEIGLTGDDNFHFKVSPDGSAWYDGFDIRNSDGAVDFIVATDDVASAGTADIGATTGLKVRITGTTAITSFGTHIHKLRFVQYTGILTLTHDATSLILLGGANRTTAAGDVGIYTSDGSGNWRERAYFRADGTPISSGHVTNLTEDTGPDPAADYQLNYSASATALKKSLLGRAPNMAKSNAISGGATLTSANFFKINRVDASGGASTITLPASATADDWLTVRKKDSSANRVTVKDNSGNDVAWLSSQYDEAMFAFWDGAWSPVRSKIAPLVQAFTSSGTYTKPPLASSIDAIAIGAGGGGGSGRRGAAGSARFGGGGGAAGVIGWLRIAAANIGATESVTVGASGSGGAAVTTDNTDGNTGANGGTSQFGNHIRGAAGGGGSGGTNAAGGGAGSQTTSGNLGSSGAGGPSSTSAAATAGGAGSTGGGGGGGGISSGDAAQSGGAGGNGSTPHGSGAISGGSGGTSGGAGGNGTDISNSTDYWGGSGGGGGAASTSAAAGAGGTGGIAGAAGGGGGASANGNNSGAGGAGARGEVRVTTYF